MQLCKSSFATKLILLLLLIYAVTTIAVLQSRISDTNQESAALSQEISKLEHENFALKDDIRSLGSDSSAIQIAHDRLGLVFKNEIIFVDENQ